MRHYFYSKLITQERFFFALGFVNERCFGPPNCDANLQVRGIFGFVGEDHIGKVMFPPIQVSLFFSPCFLSFFLAACLLGMVFQLWFMLGAIN